MFEADAEQRLKIHRSKRGSSDGFFQQQQQSLQELEHYGADKQQEPDELVEAYEEMRLDDQRYLCTIPRVISNNHTEQANDTSSEREEESTRAKARGLELLSGLKDGCMYYRAGWWSYSFCYMNEIRQFHALPPGNGIPFYPPVEDKNAKAYVLGRFMPEQDTERTEGVPSTDLADLQSTGDSRYLVQRLGHGTKCDLTDKRRQIEIHFYCHPQSTDRIAYIKETTTCNYLMVIFTPRLCNDPAFQPARQDDANQINCKLIIKPEELPEWEAAIEKAKADEEEESKVQEEREKEGGKKMDEHPIIADIRVGGRALLDKDGNVLETGQLAEVAGREHFEIVASNKKGQTRKLSKREYEKLGMTPERLEQLERELEGLSQGNGWQLELVTVHGELSLRGVLDTDTGTEETKGESAGEGNKKPQKERVNGDDQGQSERKREEDDNEQEDNGDAAEEIIPRHEEL